MNLFDLIQTLSSHDKRISHLERLDVNPPLASVVKMSGTPSANALAYWTGAGTVAAAGSVTYNGGTMTLSGPLVIGGGSQNYSFFGDGNNFTVQAQGSGNASVWGLYAKDGDGSDVVQLEFYAVGTPGNITNRERVIVGWDATNSWFRMVSNANGTGTTRPIHLFVGTNTQLYLDTNGRVYVGLTSANANTLGIKAGSSSNDAAVGGVLYVTTTQTGNVGTGEDVLASYSVPANTLAVNNQSLWFEAAGTMANNGHTVTLRVRFGTTGTNLITSYVTAVIGEKWVVRGRVVRTGAATQKGYSTYAGAGSQVDLSTALNQTLSGAVTLEVTGEGTSNNDVVLESFTVGWSDNNT